MLIALPSDERRPLSLSLSVSEKERRREGGQWTVPWHALRTLDGGQLCCPATQREMLVNASQTCSVFGHPLTTVKTVE